MWLKSPLLAAVPATVAILILLGARAMRPH
jgi:hypothetical protein